MSEPKDNEDIVISEGTNRQDDNSDEQVELQEIDIDSKQKENDNNISNINDFGDAVLSSSEIQSGDGPYPTGNNGISSNGTGIEVEPKRDIDEDANVNGNADNNDEPKDLVNTIVSRSWFLMFEFAIIGAFVGFIVYMITGDLDYIWYIGGIFCAIAFGIDILIPTDKKTTKIWCKDPMKEEEEMDPKWGGFKSFKSEFQDIYGRVAGSCTIYELGKYKNNDEDDDKNNDNAFIDDKDKEKENYKNDLHVSGLGAALSNIEGSKNTNPDIAFVQKKASFQNNSQELIAAMSGIADCRVLAVRRRQIFRQENYKGYEVGGGIGSLIGTILWGIVTFLRYGDVIEILPQNWFNTVATEWVTWLLLIIFLIFICFLIGCMMEIELRKQKYIYPIGWSFETVNWFPIYEIVNWSYYSIGFYHVEDTDKPKGIFSQLAYQYFKIMLGIVVFIFKFIGLLCYILFRNAAFGLLFIVTIAMAYAYYAHIEKMAKPLITCVGFTIFAWLISLICIWITSRGDEKEISLCGKKKTIKKLKSDDIPRKRTLCYGFSIISFFLLIAFGFTFVVLGEYYDFEVDSSSVSDRFKDITCVDYFERNDRRRMQDSDQDLYPLCPEYVEMVIVVTSLSISWVILWGLSLLWYYSAKSTFDFTVKEPNNRTFNEYTQFTIKRRVFGELRQENHSNSWLGSWSNWVLNFGSKPSYVKETIRVDLETAIKLNKYLLNVTRTLRFNQSIMSNPWLPYILPPTGISLNGSNVTNRITRNAVLIANGAYNKHFTSKSIVPSIGKIHNNNSSNSGVSGHRQNSGCDRCCNVCICLMILSFVVSIITMIINISSTDNNNSDINVIQQAGNSSDLN